MKKLSKFLSVIIVVTMIFSTSAIISGAASATNGSCGSNLKWSYDKSNCTVTISGTGEMKNYSGNSPFTKLAANNTVKKAIIKSGVTSIGEYAFGSCYDLESVTIPESVTKIKKGAFISTSLKNCTLPSKLTEIGDEAFFGTQLRTIKIPDSVTYLGKSAFASSLLSSCTLSKNIKALKDFTFLFTDLKSISIPKSVTSIGDEVFPDAMKSLRIPANVKSIGTLFSFGDWFGKTIYCYNKSLKFPSTENIFAGEATIYGQKNSTAQKFCTIYNSQSDIGNISFKTLSVSSSSVILGYSSKTYTGKALKPSVTVMDKNGYTVSSKKYTVKYSNNTNPGTANVTVTLKGNNSEVLTKTFKINPKGTEIASLNAKSKGFEAKWNKQATQTTGYQIQYSTSSKFTDKTTKTVTVKDAKTVSKTISSLKDNTKYYVRVRTYKTVSKVNYYSSWSKVKTVTTKS